MPPETGEGARPVGSAVERCCLASLGADLAGESPRLLATWPCLARPAERAFLAGWAVDVSALQFVDASICSAKLGLCGSTSDYLGRRRVRLEKTIVFCPRSTQTANESAVSR